MWLSSRAQRRISFGSSPARYLAALGMTARSKWRISNQGARTGPAIPRVLFPLPCSRAWRPQRHHPFEQLLENRTQIITAPGKDRRHLEAGPAQSGEAEAGGERRAGRTRAATG